MEKPQESTEPTQNHPSLRIKRILVIDDSEDFLDLNRIILEINHYEVVTAQSGEEGLLILTGINKLDLILVDIQMGGMSGPEFLLQLEKTRPEIFETVPVVFFTGMDQVPESKAIGFIRKPVDMKNLLAAVRRFTEGNRVLRG